MTPVGDFAIDPVTGQQIGITNKNYSVISLYYRLEPQYAKEFNDAKNTYLNRTFHDYAVNLLQTASALGLSVRPSGFRPAPLPPTAHQITIDKNYKLNISVVPVCQLPADPDPAKQTIRLSSLFGVIPEEWEIVNFTPAAPIVTNTPFGKADVIAYLRNITKDQVIDIFNQVMG